METGKKKNSPLPASKRALKKKAIAREYERKRRELGLTAPTVKRGLGFYLVLMFGMALIASLVFKQAGIVEKRKSVNTKQLFAQRSVNALAEALGRYRFHCGCYPTAEDGGLDALAAKTSRYPGWLGPYAGSWGTIIPDPWKRPYIYEPQTNGPPGAIIGGGRGPRHGG